MSGGGGKFEKLAAPERIERAKTKMEKVIDHFLYVLELHANNAYVVYSPILSSQIPTSYAASAFNIFQRSMHQIAVVRLDDYRPNHFAVFEHGHRKERSHARELRNGSGVLVGWVGSHMLPYVSNLDDLFGLSHTQQRTPSDQRFASAKLGIGARCIVLCHYSECVCFTKKQCSEGGLTQFGGVGQNGIEQAVEVAL
jgi:hypothetical protein